MTDLNDIHRSLGRIEQMVSGLTEDVTEIKITVKHHESIKNKVLGGWLALTVLISAAITFVTKDIG